MPLYPVGIVNREFVHQAKENQGQVSAVGPSHSSQDFVLRLKRGESEVIVPICLALSVTAPLHEVMPQTISLILKCFAAESRLGAQWIRIRLWRCVFDGFEVVLARLADSGALNDGVNWSRFIYSRL